VEVVPLAVLVIEAALVLVVPSIRHLTALILFVAPVVLVPFMMVFVVAALLGLFPAVMLVIAVLPVLIPLKYLSVRVTRRSQHVLGSSQVDIRLGKEVDIPHRVS
jgi:hypothetical protein